MIPALNPPKILFMELTGECNLRCRQCHLWQTKDSSEALSMQDRVRVVEELADWSPGATVALSSGETLLKRDEFFAITSVCRNRGLNCFVNTNATLIDEPTAERLIIEGPTYLSISLDSHRADAHDWLRGRVGTFETAVSGVRALVERRRAIRTSRPIQLVLNSILLDQNLLEIREYVAFATALGVDGITFQVLSPTFGLQGQSDPFFDKHFPQDPKVWDDAMQTIAGLKKDGAPILTPVSDLIAARELTTLKAAGHYPEYTETQVCDSGERNLMINQRGDVQLCFFMGLLSEGQPLGNIRNTSLKELWHSDRSVEIRKIMSVCCRSCGTLNCHRRAET